MVKPKVEITESGRGGSIYYREGENSVAFDWEFALSPVLAEISGTKAGNWDQTHPWAVGRQAEIFDFVAKEVVRQKADDCAFEIELASGSIVIFQLPEKFLDLRMMRLARPSVVTSRPKARRAHKSRSTSERPTLAYEHFIASMPGIGAQWDEGHTYDLTSFKNMSKTERRLVVGMLTGRDVTCREIAVFAEDDSPEALAALQSATQHHLSIETRLAAAEVLDKRGRMPEMEEFLARQIRLLYRPDQGLERALTLAKKHPSETIKQALLWASWNSTDCAPHCARLLLSLTGAVSEPLGPDHELMLSKLGRHSSHFERKAAFDQLCDLVRMELNQSDSE
jgi:hypothetical protein